MTERVHSQYSAAVSAGWSPDELRKIGYGEPDKKARTRKRATRRSFPAVASNGTPAEPTSNVGDDAASDVEAQPAGT